MPAPDFASWSSKNFVSLRSNVSKRSVNQPHINRTIRSHFVGRGRRVAGTVRTSGLSRVVLGPREHDLFPLKFFGLGERERNASPPRHMSMKKIGFLSFGHWTPSPQSQTRSASDALLQSIDLAVAAEELGADGAYFRVHHFARQLGSPFPLLAAAAPRPSGSRSARRSSTCGTRTRCTWRRTPAQPTLSPADVCNSASAAVRPSR